MGAVKLTPKFTTKLQTININSVVVLQEPAIGMVLSKSAVNVSLQVGIIETDTGVVLEKAPLEVGAIEADTKVVSAKGPPEVSALTDTPLLAKVKVPPKSLQQGLFQ